MIYDKILQEIMEELDRASTTHGSFNSDYEGYAVILEEVEELWEDIKKKSHDRSIPEMRKEAVQVAAMAARFVIDIRGWDKDTVFERIRDDLMNDREKIFTHHDGYGRLQKKMERLLNTVGDIPTRREIKYPSALFVVVFMVNFIFDTMNGVYREKLDGCTLSPVESEQVLGR